MGNKKRVKELKTNRTKEKFSLLLIIGIILMILLLINAQYGGSGNGQNNETLQAELDNLTAYLISQGYNWLINQTVNYSEIDAWIIGSGQSAGGI